jgi:hypothetical protein
VGGGALYVKIQPVGLMDRRYASGVGEGGVLTREGHLRSRQVIGPTPSRGFTHPSQAARKVSSPLGRKGLILQWNIKVFSPVGAETSSLH